MNDLKVLKHAIVRQNVLQQFTEFSAVPLAVAQLVDVAMFDGAGGFVEDLVERLIRRHHAQLCIKHHQRPPHGLDNALGVGTGFLGKQFGMFQLGHIHKRDHQAVDHVPDSAIGPHPHEIPGACFRVHLLSLRHQCLEDLLRIVLQAVVFQVDHNVTQRAPYIRRNQIDHVGHRRGKTFDVQVVIQEDRSNLGAVQQIGHVVVHLRQGVDFSLEFCVHRLEFFVEGLQLFLGGFQFLIGTLQFLIGRLHFFASRFELLVRGFQFLDSFL